MTRKKLALGMRCLVAVIGMSVVAAKPPGLPLDGRVRCETTSPDVVLLVEDSTEPSGLVDGIPGSTVLLVIPIAAGPAEATRSYPEVEETIMCQGGIDPTPPMDPPTCPYLQRKPVGTEAALNSEGAEEPAGSVLSNLRKIDQAARLYREGQRLEDRKEFTRAAKYYEQAREACPGCRYAVQAQEAIARLEASQIESDTGIGGEEQEKPVNDEELIHLLSPTGYKNSANIKVLIKQTVSREIERVQALDFVYALTRTDAPCETTAIRSSFWMDLLPCVEIEKNAQGQLRAQWQVRFGSATFSLSWEETMRD